MTTLTPATLVVLPGPVPPETVVLGLPLAARVARAAERAGFDRIVTSDGQPVAGLAPGRLVLLAGSVIPKTEWLRSLRQMPIEPERLYAAGNSATVIETGQPDAFLSSLPDARQGGGPLTFSSRPCERIEEPRGESGRIAIAGIADLPRAEKWLLAGLAKDEEGFMSRHVERRISLAISRRLAGTRVTPNAMTLVSVAVGLLGAGLFLSTRPWAPLGGALLVLLHSILDGCDGELARLKFQESRFGGVLDFWGDNVVHSALFGAIAVEWSRASGRNWPLLLGAAAILGTILSAAFVYRHAMAQVADGPLFTSVSRSPGSAFSRLADVLARRDFLYLLLLLAALGKAHWFLAMAAVGSPIYFLLLVAIALSGRRRGAPAGEVPGRVPVRVNNSGS